MGNVIPVTGSTSSHFPIVLWEVCCQGLQRSPRAFVPKTSLLRGFVADKALCYFEPVLIDSSLGTGVASINHLSNAAYELILQCAVRESKGGIATGIGTSQESRSGSPNNHEAREASRLK